MLYHELLNEPQSISNFNVLYQHALYRTCILYDKRTGLGVMHFFILVVSRFKTGIKLKLASKKQPQIGDSYCVLKWRLALVVMAISQLHVGAERERTNVMSRLIFYLWYVGVLQL